ncbi:four-carbon acid sugar kinase family protein [Paenibacillus sp. N4]|uniref:four-carbon acid sugar kinase family protein n=1 Tax=Paenibacillus vietnamensis TaxID=2590547 RepID=UPI001CD09F87|nr:four-carbon acid sugar kinase family protein [Paenibacillus vietnamensis]MCA0756293.1 four-carbon acid sugar kinase family protein [Paenibacillus vietnamensis]
MRQIAIIADDLTGASDSGVQFARKGFGTQVIFHIDHFSEGIEHLEVIVLDTDSRSIAANAAYERAAEAAARARKLDFQHIYKKMDSTLRGNLGAELDAVADTVQPDFTAVALAFPKIGRTTRGGIHYLNRLPVSETEIARDPKCPVTESDLVRLFDSQSKRKAGLVPLETLHAGKEAVLSRIQALLQEQIQNILFDAVTEVDMQQIAVILAASGYRILWAGSAGLADYLPDALALSGGSGGQGEASKSAITDMNHPVLLVAGSISGVTRGQVAAFNRCPDVTAVEFDTVRAITSDEGRLQDIERCRTELLEAIAAGSDVSLYASSSPEHVRLSKAAGAKRGFDEKEVSNRIAATLGEIAAGVIGEVQLQGVILTGGDTAKAVCRHLGVSGIQLVRELEPGIPLGQLVGSGSNPLWVVTKAGAFGSEQSLANAKQALKGDQSNE